MTVSFTPQDTESAPPRPRDASPGRWTGALRGLRADLLDCIQTTLALVADQAHGSGTYLALGREWRFPSHGSDGAIRVQLSDAERTEQAARVLGLELDTAGYPAGGEPALIPGLWSGETDTAPRCVIADAHDLPWTPDAGRKHAPHSFLLDRARDGYLIVDTYHIDTEWGVARPGAWSLTASELAWILRNGARVLTPRATVRPPLLDRAVIDRQNAARAQAATGQIDEYLRAVRAGLGRPGALDSLVLDIWLLTRERELHAAWRGDGHSAVQVAVEGWRQLSAQSYVAARRAARGKQVNSGTILDDMARRLQADAALVRDLAAPAANPAPGARDAGPGLPGAETVRAAVLTAVSGVLGLGQADVAGVLRDLPGFDSFRLADILSQIEEDLGVPVPAALSAEHLRDVDGLCRLFATQPDSGK